MEIELQFVDQSGDRLNELDMIYKEKFVPIPDVGDYVIVEGRNYRVTSRVYMYFSGGLKGDIRVVIYVEEK